MTTWKMVTVLLLAIIMSWTTTRGGAADDQSCIKDLIACEPYLASLDPSPICCVPLKKVVETKLSCLCGALVDPILVAAVNVTQLTELPTKCGIENAGPDLCNKAPGSSPAPPPPGNGVSNKNLALGGLFSSFMMLLVGLILH